MDEAGDLIAAHSAITHRVIGAFYSVANELGFGFLESAYRRALYLSLREEGLQVDEEVVVPVHFLGQIIGTFRADLIVEGLTILALKTADEISKAHEAQLLNSLRASTIEIGYVLAFAEKVRFRRIILQNARKRNLLP